jgi:hypothetical protein
VARRESGEFGVYLQEGESDAPELRICWQVLMSVAWEAPAELQLAVENVQADVDWLRRAASARQQV